MTRARWTQILSAIVGIAVGGAVFRSDDVWAWLSGADWTQLPASIVGATVPAVAGFAFARALATNSVRTLKRAELEEVAKHELEQDDAAMRDRVDRQAAWDRLYEVSRPLVESPNRYVFVSAVRDRAREVREAAKVAGQPTVELLGLDSAAEELAFRAVEFGEVMRSNLSEVVAVVDALVNVHRVETLRLPSRALHHLQSLAEDRPRWSPRDVDMLVATAEARVRSDRPGGRHELSFVEAASNTGYTAILQLRRLAHVLRQAPPMAHEVENLDTYSAMLETFTRLEDHLSAGPP